MIISLLGVTPMQLAEGNLVCLILILASPFVMYTVFLHCQACFCCLLYLLLCLLGVIEAHQLLVFWIENVFVIGKTDSCEKKSRRITKDRFIVEDRL